MAQNMTTVEIARDEIARNLSEQGIPSDMFLAEKQAALWDVLDRAHAECDRQGVPARSDAYALRCVGAWSAGVRAFVAASC